MSGFFGYLRGPAAEAQRYAASQHRGCNGRSTIRYSQDLYDTNYHGEDSKGKAMVRIQRVQIMD